MKIYFTLSLSQTDDHHQTNCKRILDFLKKQKHNVFPEEILQKHSSFYHTQTDKEALTAQRELTKMKKLADLVIVEISRQSLAVGQEINLALSLGKPVIALYEEGHQPHVLRDEGGDLLLLTVYNDKNLEEVVKDALEYASSQQDVRFNFFISPSIGNYLDWISKEKKIPRSVYLRNLIEKSMEADEEYNS